MRTRVADWLTSHPVTGAVLLTVAWHAVLFAAAELLPSLGGWPDLTATVINLITAAVTLAFIAWLRWWRQSALPWRGPDRSWLYLIPVLLIVLSYAAPGLQGALASLAGLSLAIGVTEEALSRGLVQHVLSGLGPVRAAAWVGVVFGLGHALSAAWFGHAWDDTLAQVITAGSLGFCFAALRWHVRTIWPLAFLHGLNDFTQFASPGAAPCGRRSSSSSSSSGTASGFFAVLL
ncbi:CPBP family intramembrane glutamic endopeptidase [Thermocatellispora tengchongensis]|uniref:CPBP family intramembrane glutamic endopeptidase n=1 Tax=Thermocatellispora tengchongensis TaxID=1073253 RepID=UPI00362C736F